MLIIGSTAIKHYFPDFKRSPKDLDYVVESKKGLKNSPGIEYLENPIILKYQQDGYLRPDLMLSLKISHMFWDINWEKSKEILDSLVNSYIYTQIIRYEYYKNLFSRKLLWRL